MIPFIFVIAIILFILLMFAFIYEVYTLGVLSSMGIMLVGTEIAIRGMQGLKNTLTDAIGLIFIGVGLIILMMATYEEYSKYM